jgi:hypothetical protein
MYTLKNYNLSLLFLSRATKNFFSSLQAKMQQNPMSGEKNIAANIFSVFCRNRRSLLIEKINREFLLSAMQKKKCFSSYGEVEPLNLELDSVNQFLGCCSCGEPNKRMNETVKEEEELSHRRGLKFIHFESAFYKF